MDKIFCVGMWAVWVIKKKELAFHQGICGSFPDILCVLEMKLEAMFVFLVKEIWGPRSCEWLVVPAMGLFGRILMVENLDKVKVLDSELGAFSLSISCKSVGVDIDNEWEFWGSMRPTRGLMWMTSWASWMM